MNNLLDKMINFISEYDITFKNIEKFNIIFDHLKIIKLILYKTNENNEITIDISQLLDNENMKNDEIFNKLKQEYNDLNKELIDFAEKIFYKLKKLVYKE